MPLPMKSLGKNQTNTHTVHPHNRLIRNKNDESLGIIDSD